MQIHHTQAPAPGCWPEKRARFELAVTGCACSTASSAVAQVDNEDLVLMLEAIVENHASFRTLELAASGSYSTPGAQVDNEDLVLTLEAIVEKFEDEMAPFAVGLTQHLAAAFWRATAAEVIKEKEKQIGPFRPLEELTDTWACFYVTSSAM